MNYYILILIFFSVVTNAENRPLLSEEAVIFHTDCGDMAVAFYPEVAPHHTEQILKLVRNGVYTHKNFFRTDKAYVTQVENFNSRQPPLSAEELKLIEKIPAEFNKVPHRRGILSMARFDDPNSAESSFSFVLGDAPNLDGKYTVFGEVIKNIEVLDEIEKLPPKSVFIQSAEVVARQDLINLKLAPAHSLSATNTITMAMGQNSDWQIAMLTLVFLLILILYGKFKAR